MYKTKFNNSFLSIILLLSALSFESCKTTKSLAKESIEPNAPLDAPFIVAHDVVFPDLEGNYKYIFFRLINPAYKILFILQTYSKVELVLQKQKMYRT